VATSFIAYRHTRLDAHADLVSLVGKGFFKPADQATVELVQKLRAGLNQSAFTARGYKLLDLK
jgi:hypothetical protein